MCFIPESNLHFFYFACFFNSECSEFYLFYLTLLFGSIKTNQQLFDQTNLLFDTANMLIYQNSKFI